jgi:hypothetical protein
MNKQQKYIDDYFATDADRKWKIQNYIAGLSTEQLFKLYIEKKINHVDMTVRRYLSNNIKVEENNEKKA